MASELRSRLVAALHETDVRVESEADAALAVFAAWLRERADEFAAKAARTERLLGGRAAVRPWSSAALALADEIDPREASDDGR